MNPVEIGTGKSFKGLAAYLLHDVREEGEDLSVTSERVGWAQSFNLDSAAPDRAWRLMAMTAMSADDLKAAAGIKKGKAAKNTVYHFSLNFNPEDRPSEEVQRLAVTSALKALQLDQYQALAVSHTDKDHQHVHVMVNLIHPETGLSAASKQPDGKPSPLSNSQRKLSTWAKKFEQEHGLEITKGRLDNAAKRASGEYVDARRKPRHLYEQEKREGQDERLEWLQLQENQRAAAIAVEGQQMTDRHQQEWATLKASYAARKNALWKEREHNIELALERIREDNRKRWQTLSMLQRSEAQDFERDEQSIGGRLAHAVFTFRRLAGQGNALGGLLAAFSKEERRAVVDTKHNQERVILDGENRAESRRIIARIKENHAGALVQARHGFLKECADLKERQDQARVALRAQWRAYNTDRQATFQKAQAPVVTRVQSQGQEMERSRGLYYGG